MRYLKTLFLVLFAFLSSNVFAVDEAKLGSWIDTSGQFYLYNVSKQAYLCGGGSWSTHAWLERVPGNLIQLEAVNGSYRIKTFSKGNANNCLGLDGTDPWMDKNPNNYDCLFTFTEVEVEGFNVGYVIKHSRGNLGASDYKVLFDMSEAASTWVLISPDDLNARMQGVIPSEGVDATHLIKNPGIANQTQYGDGFWNNGWLLSVSEGTWSWGSNATGGTSNTNVTNEQAAEIWNGKFTIKQTLSNMPSGRYALSVYGYERVGNDASRTDVDAYFYAGDSQQLLNPINAGDASINTLDNAEKAFMAGKYQNNPIKFDVSADNGSIEIGAANPANQFFDWVVINNFQLNYFGNAPLLKEFIEKANELVPTLDEQNAAGLQAAIDEAQAVLDNEQSTNAEIQEALEALEEAYKNFNAVNEAKQLAYDVLTQVPAALYPEDFDWDAERNYKYYKNNEGKYQLASREVVAILIELLDIVENPTEENELAADEAAMLLNAYARLVVETHSVGAALEEQGDPGFAEMYEYETDEYYKMLWAYYSYYFGFMLSDTFSDLYEGLNIAFDGNPGFDANYTAHITNPDLEDGTEGWENDGFRTLSDQPLTDAVTTYFGEDAQYTYFDQWSQNGFKADAYQTLHLPAGRYMLTVAGRGGANKAFTEIGAQDPDNYFQLYATDVTNGVTKMQSIEQIGDKDGVFGNGWNDYSVYFTMASAGDVKIGIRAASSGEGWVSATRFRLTRLGDGTIYLNENETFDPEMNFDGATWLMGIAPTDMLLHKEMKAGRWYSIAVPGDLPYDQIIREFGEGTLLAQPLGVLDLDAEGKQKLLGFLEWDPMEYYAMYGMATDNAFGWPVDGILANTPYLIKPAKVKASNRYLFKDIIASEKKSVEECEYSWGAISVPDTDNDWGFWTSDYGPIKFYPNYTYKPGYADGYTVEVCDTVKAYTGLFEVEGDAEIGTILMLTLDEEYNLYLADDANDIPVQQILDLVALGQQKAEWYPGIPAAMANKLTTVPELDDYVTTLISAINSLKTAITEAQKAYEPSKKFNSLMAEAKELLNSDHNELVEGADAAFKKKIETLQRTFDRQLTAEPINGLIEQLEEAIAEYKEQIFIAGTIEDANYYILNVGTGKYLNGGNSWGTRASLTDNREYFTTAKLEDGTYTLESRFSNGGEQYYLGPNYYVDNGNPMHLTITPVSETAFTISCTGDSGFGYLGWDGSESTEVRVLAEAADENAQWTFVPVADVLADIPNATVEEPKDATPLIKDAYFGRNHREASAWEGDGFGTNSQGNTNAEKWGGNSQTFDIHQTVTVPDGVYRLTFFGYYRYNNTTDNTTQVAIDTHKDGTEVINSFVYANDVEVALKSIADEKAVEVLGEANLPFSQDAAGQAFAQGLYKNEILVKVEGGKLVLGIKKIDHPGCDWTVWDDFILTYYGDTTIEDVLKAYPVETGTATGITEVNTGVNTGAIFNLNGVRVNNMTKKGVYIVNGKKVVVK